MKSNRTLERSVLSKTIKWYRSRGWVVIRLRSVDPAGYPDLLIIRNGIVKFIELKRADGLGKLSALQETRIAELQLHGIETLLL